MNGRVWLLLLALNAPPRRIHYAAGAQLKTPACLFWVQVQVDYANIYQDINVTFTPSATGLELYQPQTGVVLPGWNVDGIEVLPFHFDSSPLAQSGASASAAHSPGSLSLNPPTQGKCARWLCRFAPERGPGPLASQLRRRQLQPRVPRIPVVRRLGGCYLREPHLQLLCYLRRAASGAQHAAVAAGVCHRPQAPRHQVTLTMGTGCLSLLERAQRFFSSGGRTL